MFDQTSGKCRRALRWNRFVWLVFIVILLTSTFCVCVCVCWERAVRDTADNSIVQFMYGEDGIDVSAGKAQFLAADRFPFLVRLRVFRLASIVDDC